MPRQNTGQGLRQHWTHKTTRQAGMHICFTVLIHIYLCNDDTKLTASASSLVMSDSEQVQCGWWELLLRPTSQNLVAKSCDLSNEILSMIWGYGNYYTNMEIFFLSWEALGDFTRFFFKSFFPFLFFFFFFFCGMFRRNQVQLSRAKHSRAYEKYAKNKQTNKQKTK